jgi:2-iminobutanoate/2-iminopropanoate deaminase
MKFQALTLVSLLIIGTSCYATNTPPVENILAPTAPKPDGAYSQATRVDLQKGKLIFISGQVAEDPKTGKLLEGDIHTATHQTLDNIGAILKAAGSDWKYVVRMDVFLKNFNDWAGMNEEYVKRFPNGVYPARQAVQVGMENRIEISCIAFVPNKTVASKNTANK